MATGNPTQSRGGSWSDIAITYPGKLDAARVRATLPAVLREAIKGAPLDQASLIFGENLSVLAALARDEKVRGKVTLVYIDPPYATQTSFATRDQQHAYHDNLTGPAYVEFVRQRLIFLRDLLSADGSIYVHADAQTMPYMKLVLDELFGSDGCRNIISRRKCNPKNYTRQQFGNVIDYVLFYTRSRRPIWNRPLEARSAASTREYAYVEPESGRRYMKVPIHAPGVRNGATGRPWRGLEPPPGKHWQYTPDRLDAFDAAGEIAWSVNGNPRRKVYLDERQGVPVQDLWLEFRDAHNQMVRITGYPTEKPEAMLELIIKASSNEGDLVLDAFAGSGTTLAVAARLRRRWIGVDESKVAIRSIVDRLRQGLAPMGDFVSKPGRSDLQGEMFSAGDRDGSEVPQVHFSLWATQECLLQAVNLADAMQGHSLAA